jgi:hypothetical protein
MAAACAINQQRHCTDYVISIATGALPGWSSWLVGLCVIKRAEIEFSWNKVLR